MNEPPISNPLDEEEEKNSQPSFYSDGMSPIDSDTSGHGLAWLMLGVAAMGCGLLIAAGLFFFRTDAQVLYDQYFPSPTATHTNTPNMTATQRVIILTNTAQAVETIAADASQQWEVAFSDSFDKDFGHWQTGVDDDEYAKILRTIDKGKYHWDATSKKGFIKWLYPPTMNVSDFYLAVDIERSDDFDGSDYGLIFRKNPGGDFYYFGIDRGSFIVALYLNGGWSDLITWTKTTAISPDKKNRLTVIAQGPHFIFLINGRRVGEASNNKIKNGAVALALEIHSENHQAIIAFDNFELRIP